MLGNDLDEVDVDSVVEDIEVHCLVNGETAGCTDQYTVNSRGSGSGRTSSLRECKSDIHHQSMSRGIQQRALSCAMLVCKTVFPVT